MKIAIGSFLFFLLTFVFVQHGQSQSSKQTDFSRDIAPLLLENCLSCHGDKKAENGFVVSDRTSFMSYVSPGNAATSSLWTDYLTQVSKEIDKDSLVMPPNGPLSISQRALIRLWIDEGADWPEGLSLRTTSEVSSAGGLGAKAFRAIGYFHPAMVHFPIALFLVGGACAFLSYFLGAKCQTTAFQCVAFAAFTCVITVVMGWSFAETQGYPAWDKALPADASHRDANVFYHRWLGTLTSVIGVLCVIVALLARRYKSTRLGHAWRIIAIALAALVAVVGHQGGELVYGEIFDKALEQLFK